MELPRMYHNITMKIESMEMKYTTSQPTEKK